MTATANNWFHTVLVLLLERSHANLDNLELLRGHRQQRPQERFPLEHEQQQTGADASRQRKRHIDVPQDAQPAHAVEPRRFQIVLRHLAEELVEQEHREPVGDARCDQRDEMVDPAELLHYVVERQRDRLEWQHEAEDHQRQHQAFTGKIEDRKGEAGSAVDDDASSGRDAGEQDRIPDDLAEARLDHLNIGVERHRPRHKRVQREREDVGEDLFVGAQR